MEILEVNFKDYLNQPFYIFFVLFTIQKFNEFQSYSNYLLLSEHFEVSGFANASKNFINTRMHFGIKFQNICYFFEFLTQLL